MQTAVLDGLFTKRAETDDEAVRVRHEAAVLQQVRHPGIVDLRDHGEGNGRPWLNTVAVVGPALELIGTDAEALARLVASLATTLADLHDLGASHGAVDADHVLLRPDGRPVLCSLGRSATTTPIDEAAAEDVAG